MDDIIDLQKSMRAFACGQLCSDCGTPIGHDNGPRDGWQLEDGRTVCDACCVEDAKRVVASVVDKKTP